jgi:hypothetical protein
MTTPTFSMSRKIASTAIALVVAGGVLVAVPAEAATKISNGVTCKKAGSTKKTSGGSYKCAKNPLSTSKKLTWLSLSCLATANDAVKIQKSSKTTVAKFRKQLPVIEAGITTETANLAEIQAKLDEATLRLAGAKVKLANAKTASDKKLLGTAVLNWGRAKTNYAKKVRSINLTLKKFNTAKLDAVNKPAELTANVANAKASAKLICTKGY